MTCLSEKVALVTEASIGIGRAVAERLVKLGMKVVGCARNESALKQIANEVKRGAGRNAAREVRPDERVSGAGHVQGHRGKVWQASRLRQQRGARSRRTTAFR